MSHFSKKTYIVGKFKAMKLALSTAESKGSTDVTRNSNLSLKLLVLLFSVSFLGKCLHMAAKIAAAASPHNCFS